MQDLCRDAKDRQFQSTPPARGATTVAAEAKAANIISIHAPREGGDPYTKRTKPKTKPFQSTPPARGATIAWRTHDAKDWDFNPRPPRGGRQQRPYKPTYLLIISIHAPREGGDAELAQLSGRKYQFQSTPPARGATQARTGEKRVVGYFNPRPPRGGRQQRCTVLPADL